MQAYIREKLLSCLLEIPALIDLYQKRDPLFSPRVLLWLEEAEKLLQQLRLPLASLVACERGKVLATADGYRDPLIIAERLTARKAGMATASMALNRVQEEMRRIITEIDGKFEVWREKMVQFLAVATQKCPISLPPTEPREAWLRKVWAELNINGDTQGMYRYLNASMQPADRLYLLNEVIVNLLDVE